MPAREFDSRRFRQARAAARMRQIDVALRAGLRSHLQVSKLEAGKAHADPDKLPAFARALGEDIDVLFPRYGEPDLADLRADAELTQAAAGERIGISRLPIARAERGERRLAHTYEAPLAEAYGVTVQELLAAQERSFGQATPLVRPVEDSGAEARSGPPRTVAEKLSYLLEETFAPADRPSDAEIAARGNYRVGTAVLSAQTVEKLRSGEKNEAAEAELDALAAALDVPPLFFRSDSAAVHRIVSGVQLMKGGLTGVAARGGAEALPPELLDYITAAVADIRASGPRDSAADENS